MEIEYEEIDVTNESLDDFREEDIVRAGKSLIADIDDRINREFMSVGDFPVEVTASGRYGRYGVNSDIN